MFKYKQKRIFSHTAGEVISTLQITSIESWTGFKPKTSISVGVKIIDWYKDFYKIHI